MNVDYTIIFMYLKVHKFINIYSNLQATKFVHVTTMLYEYQQSDPEMLKIS